ncbi:hypothetical protein [Massilia glaciei]|uniref:Uncharacterized protein n=1 Tax=Massilia glaciei TaxID=1524097 RepID=A0A2U2H9V6_9BURK|nr:hypothetical protein [Massilia glaciei]PWF39450.1 hypothetical protein C7C56_027005 [Massilia glaciei]
MEFSDKELALIEAAKSKASGASIGHVMLLVAMLAGLALMFAGLITSNVLAYLMMAAVGLSIALPQLGAGPKYEDLVKLLASKSKREDLAP